MTEVKKKHERAQIPHELWMLVDAIARGLWLRTCPKRENDWDDFTVPGGVWHKFRGEAFALIDSLDLGEWQIRRISYVETPEAPASSAEMAIDNAEQSVSAA